MRRCHHEALNVLPRREGRHFESDKDPIEGAGVVIGGYWCDQMVDFDQQRWDMFFEAGLVSRSVAMSWADEVWCEPEQDDENPDDNSVTEAL